VKQAIAGENSVTYRLPSYQVQHCASSGHSTTVAPDGHQSTCPQDQPILSFYKF